MSGQEQEQEQEQKQIINKLIKDIDILYYFIKNNSIPQITPNIIPILYENYDYLFTIIKYGYGWKLENLKRLYLIWTVYRKMISHDMKSIIDNKTNIKKLVQEKYSYNFNPYDMDKEWFLPSDLLN